MFKANRKNAYTYSLALSVFKGKSGLMCDRGCESEKINYEISLPQTSLTAAWTLRTHHPRDMKQLSGWIKCAKKTTKSSSVAFYMLPKGKP